MQRNTFLQLLEFLMKTLDLKERYVSLDGQDGEDTTLLFLNTLGTIAKSILVLLSLLQL